jgi:deoxyribodipyrimidine photo-lyase
MTAPSLLWFRRDLRLADHHALTAAAGEGPVVALFVLDDETPGQWATGAAQRWWLHHTLAALSDRLGGKLLLRRGRAADVVRSVAAEIGATAVHATRLYEPWERATEQALGDLLTLHDGETLIPPEQVTTRAGTPFKVYGAFWRTLAEQLPPPPPLAEPEVTFADPPRSDRLDQWGLLPTKPDWASRFADFAAPGEAGALAQLDAFVPHSGTYHQRRNQPSDEGTSRLSPHLHFGEVSPRQVWHALALKGGAKFLKELAWRDFSRSALLAQPDLAEREGREAMARIAWRNGPEASADFAAWKAGRTGYPIVDAGMRQLWATGWMHNRVRMITASFLVKHLLLDWKLGAAWFWDTLVDADLANNALNWQWIAGTGTASQGFERVMAPLLQSAKFDAANYIRTWVPELAGLGDDIIHDPLSAHRGTYPMPLIGHREARERALAALARSRVG